MAKVQGWPTNKQHNNLDSPYETRRFGLTRLGCVVEWQTFDANIFPAFKMIILDISFRIYKILYSKKRLTLAV